MNSRINQIICDYTSGDVSVEETNRKLIEEKAGFTFVPGKNHLTEEEIASTHVGKNKLMLQVMDYLILALEH